MRSMLLLCLLCGCMSAVVAQKSPGPLSSMHATFGEPDGCTSCHEKEDGTGEFGCFACHEEIQARILGRKGYHGSVLEPNATAAECAACHAEHQGAEAHLLPWGDSPAGFDHSEAGFTLEGRHISVDCRGCHNPRNMPKEAAEQLGGRDLARTFLGLSRDCQTCHLPRSPHGDQFAGSPRENRCGDCHSPKGFSPSSFTRARHGSTRFPLEGAHAATACTDCHASPLAGAKQPSSHGRRFRFPGLACVGCHENPHVSEASSESPAADCSACHRVNGWKPNLFTREKHTKFALTGAHVRVPCVMCHQETREVGTRKVRVFAGTPKTCRGCHSEESAQVALRSIGEGRR